MAIVPAKTNVVVSADKNDLYIPGKVGVGISIAPNTTFEIRNLDSETLLNTGASFSIQDFSHGVTDWMADNAYAALRPVDREYGGLNIIGLMNTLGEGGSTYGVKIDGICTGYSPIVLNSSVPDGTGVDNVANEDRILSIQNCGSEKIYALGNGSLHGSSLYINDIYHETPECGTTTITVHDTDFSIGAYQLTSGSLVLASSDPLITLIDGATNVGQVEGIYDPCGTERDLIFKTYDGSGITESLRFAYSSAATQKTAVFNITKPGIYMPKSLASPAFMEFIQESFGAPSGGAGGKLSTNTFGYIGSQNEATFSEGGLLIHGTAKTDCLTTVSPLVLEGHFNYSDPTDSVPAIKIRGYKNECIADLAAAETVLSILNNATELIRVAGNGNFFPVQAATASAPAYVKGAIYFDTTLNKLRVGGATGWETVAST